MKRSRTSIARHYFNHLTCTLFVVLGLLGILAPASQAATGVFTFSSATAAVGEGAGKINITINRVGGSTGSAAVSFRTNQISAIAGSDFVGMPLTTLNFAHRERQKVVSVNIMNDTLVEPNETFEVLLSNPTYGTSISNISSSVITIQDNDIATIDTTAPTVSLTSPATGTTLTSAQTVTIAASAADNVGVSKVELYDGAILIATELASPYSISWAITSANNGSHSFTAKAFDAAGNSKVSTATAVAVNIPVPDLTAPTVSLTSPTTGTTLTSAQTLAIAASASDNVGVSKVELYDGTTLKGADTTTPYSFAWAITDANNGNHSLTAKAYDAAGNVASSTAVGITINIAVAASVYEAPVLNSVTISNGNYLLAWTLPATAYGVPAGGYDVFTDGADDNLHHTTLSAIKSGLPLDIEHCFVVEARWTQAVPSVFPASNKICVQGTQNADATDPTVSLTNPVSNTTFTSAQTVTIAASAADNVGVSKVELYDGATLKGTATTAPYSFAWAITAANNGSHSLTAKAYDAASNNKVSAASTMTVNISVADLTAPTVSLTSPATGTTLTSAQTLTVAASAADNIGVSKVELYDGTTLKGTDTTAPYSFAWAITSANNGSHSLTAKAYDAAGNSKISAAHAVTVNIAPLVTAKPGSFEFAVSANTVNENDGQVDVTINRVGGSDGQVTVDFRTSQLTALNTDDYVGITQKSLVFASGETWKTERLSIVNDSVQEGTETFKVILSNPTASATLGTVTESIITILDDDATTTPPPVISGPVKSFPGAEGFGAVTPAGRGGKIVKVTNLNDSGAGSLREALYNTPGKRIVVFEVAGIINLTSPLVIREPFVTIAGQSAPSSGISLSGYGMRIYTHDVLVKHLFFRGNTTLVDQDCLSIQPSGTDRPYNVIIDHCSFAWAYDENISIFPGYTDQTDQSITVSNCLVGEGHYGVLIGTNSTRVSFLHNVVLSTVERQPRLGGSTYANVVNNLLYNVGGYEFSAVGSTYGPDQVSYAANAFIAGPSSRSSVPGIGTSSIQSGSKIYAPTSGAHANTASNNLSSAGIGTYLASVPPVSLDGITVTPVSSLEATLASSAGARPAQRGTTYGDSVDERFFSEIQTRRGSVKDRVQPSWTEKPVAATRDIDPLLPANPNSDDNSNGYTNIEEVLYQMALQVEE